MTEDIKILLGDAASNFSDELITLVTRRTITEVEGYVGKSIDGDFELTNICEDIVVIKLNRINTEGLASLTTAGSSENYLDGYPINIQNVLNRKRKIKVI